MESRQDKVELERKRRRGLSTYSRKEHIQRLPLPVSRLDLIAVVCAVDVSLRLCYCAVADNAETAYHI